MQGKTLVQIFFFLIIILISYLFIKTYFLKKDEIKKKISKIEKININVIEEISYRHRDLNGNEYNLKAMLTEIDGLQPDIVIMKTVKAVITLKNDTPIIIHSKNAYYNKKTQYTHFFDNVKMNYDPHFIKSDNIKLNFQKQFITISDTITYNYLKTTMEADKIEFNLFNKSSKIFMRNKNDQVKIENRK
tara:strand:+ start:756 stop:1322 length:567 start_codon:yes stop_codon:yes gene_type:complete